MGFFSNLSDGLRTTQATQYVRQYLECEVVRFKGDSQELAGKVVMAFYEDHPELIGNPVLFAAASLAHSIKHLDSKNITPLADALFRCLNLLLVAHQRNFDPAKMDKISRALFDLAYSAYDRDKSSS